MYIYNWTLYICIYNWILYTYIYITFNYKMSRDMHNEILKKARYEIATKKFCFTAIKIKDPYKWIPFIFFWLTIKSNRAETKLMM